ARPTFGAETPTANRAIIVAFDVNHLAIFDIDTLPAPHSAVWTDALEHLCIVNAWFQVLTSFAYRVRNLSHVRVKSFINRARGKSLGKPAKYSCKYSHENAPCPFSPIS